MAIQTRFDSQFKRELMVKSVGVEFSGLPNCV